MDTNTLLVPEFPAVATLHTISSERKQKILSYTWDDVKNINTFAIKKWKKYVEAFPGSWLALKDIVLYHPDQVIAHDAAFVMATIGHPLLVDAAYTLIKRGEGIIRLHEILDVLTEVPDWDLLNAYRLVLKLQKGDYFSNPITLQDWVADTVTNVRVVLEKRLQKLWHPYREALRNQYSGAITTALDS